MVENSAELVRAGPVPAPQQLPHLGELALPLMAWVWESWPWGMCTRPCPSYGHFRRAGPVGEGIGEVVG